MLILCLSLGGLLGTSILRAQTFEDGYQSYMRNQFPVAELQFRNALKQAQAKEDRAFILKFIGICQYMRGDKKGAGSTFYQSLSSDPNVTIDEEEVLDSSVVGYFMSVKSKWMKDQQGAMGRSSAQTTAPPARVPAETATPAPSSPPKSTRHRRRVAKKAPPPPAPPPEVKESDGKTSWLHVLPFGSGQFYNGSYLLGTGFALAEAYSLYRISSLDQRIVEQRSLNFEVQNESRITNEEKEQFFKENGQFISELKAERSLAIAAFFGLWAIGITEAIINAPSPLSNADSEDSEEASLSPYRLNSWHTAWLPTPQGGTFVIGFRLPFK